MEKQLTKKGNHMKLLKEISAFLQQGDEEKVIQFTKKAIEQNISPKTILDTGLISGMNVIGELFKKHEIFLPEVLLAAKAMNAGMNELKPLLIKEKISGIGKVILGTVYGDLHDIGKNLVGIMLKGAGFEVIDLGKSVAPEIFIETAIKEKAQVIGMSALLTTTMPIMKKTIDLLKERNPENSIKTVVGGAPLSQKIANEFGADGYAYDASHAVEQVKRLI
jgi:5-methyltetrahydrofolate--homocysteine methyltransferase